MQKKRHFDALEPRYSGADEMRRGDGSIRSHCEIPSGSSSPFDTRPIPAPHSHAQVGTSPFSSLVNFNEGRMCDLICVINLAEPFKSHLDILQILLACLPQ